MDASSASSMVSSSVCKKQKVDQNVVAGADRISKLPDMVLRHILSFLSITDAVGTIILSKRFDNMWTSLPNLYFYHDEDDNRDIFMNFVERVLTHRDFSSLHAITLDCLVYGDVIRINTWISAAVRRNVQLLRLTLIDIKTSLVLPYDLFTLNSLQELYIYMLHVLVLPSSIHFSSLRKLSLLHVIFPNDLLTQQFFSGCPVLEVLDIFQCNWVNVRAVSISSPNLKRLTIWEIPEEDEGAGSGCQIMILANSLKFFRCKDGFRNEYVLWDTSSLVRTSLIILNDISQERIREVAYRLHKLLKALQNTSKLKLTSRAVEVLGSAKELFMHVPVLNSLSYLKLKGSAMALNLEGLHKILQNSPHLEYLYFAGGIELPFWSSEKDDQIFDPVPSCFESQLKTIRVDHFTGSDDEMSVVKILLAHGAVLEKLVICPKYPDLAVHEQLLLLPRNCACSINLVEPENYC